MKPGTCASTRGRERQREIINEGDEIVDNQLLIGVGKLRRGKTGATNKKEIDRMVTVVTTETGGDGGRNNCCSHLLPQRWKQHNSSSSIITVDVASTHPRVTVLERRPPFSSPLFCFVLASIFTMFRWFFFLHLRVYVL